jgi:hypothetical protein
MKLMHKNGFSDSERATFLPIINMNIVECITILLKEINKQGLKFAELQNNVRRLSGELNTSCAKT